MSIGYIGTYYNNLGNACYTRKEISVMKRLLFRNVFIPVSPLPTNRGFQNVTSVLMHHFTYYAILRIIPNHALLPQQILPVKRLGRQWKTEALNEIFQGEIKMYSVKQEADRCLKCKKAMCSAHCPVSTAIPQVMELFLNGEGEWMGRDRYPGCFRCRRYCIRT